LYREWTLSRGNHSILRPNPRNSFRKRAGTSSSFKIGEESSAKTVLQGRKGTQGAVKDLKANKMRAPIEG